MIFLSGHVHKSLYYRDDFGFLLTPMMGNRPPADHLWAADTGCFKNPDAFDVSKYLQFLRARNPDTCLFATAPDIVGDARRTIARSLSVLLMIRALGYSAALVAQDGLEHERVPWNWFDCLFIGGTTKWKLGRAARALGREAVRRGKWLHMGRVNSGPRAIQAELRGCHSIDGTLLAFGRDFNLPVVTQWLKFVNRQTTFTAN